MEKFGRLLCSIADELNIRRGTSESVEYFKRRIIYSVISRTAYASLWDKDFDDESCVSVRHVKGKISKLLNIYLQLYPEARIDAGLSEELYKNFLTTGLIYHKAYRVAPSICREAVQGKILFLRGMPPNEKVFVSGAGFYKFDEKNFLIKENLSDIHDMFEVPEKNLETIWQELLDKSVWHVVEDWQDMEFLRVSPPFNRGYWQDKPERNGKISLARSSGQFEPRSYYSYKFSDGKFLCSQIPQWQTYDEHFQSSVYRKFSCACLAALKTLPPTEFKTDGDVVHVNFKYLFPPSELRLMRLYSWPQFFDKFPNDFKRTFDTKIFFALKPLFEQLGYEFKGE